MTAVSPIRGPHRAAGLLLSALLWGCGARIVFIFFSVGGAVHGLTAGLTLVITDNGGDAVTITTPGAFVFPTRIAGGDSYDVTILTQPLGESCSIANGRGTVNADITDVMIDCAPAPNGVGASQAGALRAAPAPYGSAPRARQRASSWTDRNGDVWLFGGSTELDGSLVHWNDLWRFSPETHLWTWVSGSDTPNAVGVYGSRGRPSANSVPGARSGAATWTDAAGDLWLSGGESSTDTAAAYQLDDLWRFSPASGLWTWMNGSVGR